MIGFLKHFFGESTTVEFTNFTLAHFAPIAIAVVMIYLIYRYRKTIQGLHHERFFRYFLAFALILSEMSYYWRLVALPSLDPNPVEHLPITVCGWVAVLSSYMLIGKSQTLFDISYFWALSCSTFALITPEMIVYTGPTRFRYYQFWAEHLLSYVAIFYMIFIHRMRPTMRSFLKAYICLLFLAGIADYANQIIGSDANYLFLAQNQTTPAILNLLPTNLVVRRLVMLFVITVLFALVYLPWYVKDRRAAYVHRAEKDLQRV